MSVELDIGVVNTSHLYGLFKLFKEYGKDSDYIFTYDTPINYLKGLNADYKKGRQSPGDEYFIGYNLGREILSQAGFIVLSREGYEADHLIIQAKNELVNYYDGVKVITNDRDLAVVVDPKTTWVSTRKKQGVINLTNYEEVLACPYNAIHLKKALVGDPSDNLKGVYRFGEAKFKKFVIDEELYNRDVYGSEQTIIEQTNLLDDTQKEQALSDLRLIKPLHVPNVNLDFRDIDWGYLLSIFELFQMKSLYQSIT